jgi:indolepyruvate decarboxylase
LFRSTADFVVGASAIITPANLVAETERLIAEALYNWRPVYMAFPPTS